jgi:hypothetical protein
LTRRGCRRRTPRSARTATSRRRSASSRAESCAESSRSRRSAR